MRSENTGTSGGNSGCDELTATDLLQGKLLLRPEALAVDDAGERISFIGTQAVCLQSPMIMASLSKRFLAVRILRR
jgi:hypothetical protein